MFLPHVFLLLIHMIWIIYVRPSRDEYPGLNIFIVIILAVLNIKDFAIIHFCEWKKHKSQIDIPHDNKPLVAWMYIKFELYNLYMNF